MIIEISKGDDPGNLMKYLVGPGKQNEHTLPHAVSGSLGGVGPELDLTDAQYMAEDLRTYQRASGTVVNGGKHIWHASVAIGADEGKLSDQVWESIADEIMVGMGFVDPAKAPVRWTAVHHGQSTKGNDHIHIVMSCVREDGTKVDTWRDHIKAGQVAIGIEKKYGLKPVPGRTSGTSAQPYTKNDGGRAKDLNTEPRRQQLEVMVRAAATKASSESEFVAELSKQGLKFKAKRDTAGKVVGYSVNLPKTITKGGVEHWWAGSKLARDLSLPRLRQQWVTPPVKKPTQAGAVRELKEIQSAAPTATPEQLAQSAHQVAGALAAAGLPQEAREIGKVAQTKTYTWRASPPALSITTMMLAANDPSGPAGQAVMLRQLLATMSAVGDAAKAGRRNPSMAGEDPADELVESTMTLGVTVAARLVEQHARGKQAERTVEQKAASQASSPSGSTGSTIPDKSQSKEEPVVTVTASGMSADQQARLATAVKERDPEQWKTGHEPLSQKQAYSLRQKGIDTDGVSKAEASLIIGGRAATVDEARQQLAKRMAMAAPEAPLTSAPVITTTAKPRQGRGK